MNPKYAEDVQNRLLHAKMCHEAWWLLTGVHPRRDSIVRACNHYLDFFLTLHPALFTTFVIKLASLFDESPDSISLKSLDGAQSDNMFSSVWERGRRLYKYRSKILAHRDKRKDERDFARETGFRYDDFGILIQDACGIYDRLAIQAGECRVPDFSCEVDFLRLIARLDPDAPHEPKLTN